MLSGLGGVNPNQTVGATLLARVREHDVAVAEGARALELQVDALLDALVERAARAEHERVHDDLVLVDEPGRRELRDERAAAEDHEALIARRLELLHFADEVARD